MAKVEQTLVLVKPDAVHRADEILDLAQANGFIILQVTSLLYSCCLYIIYAVGFTSSLKGIKARSHKHDEHTLSHTHIYTHIPNTEKARRSFTGAS